LYKKIKYEYARKFFLEVTGKHMHGNILLCEHVKDFHVYVTFTYERSLFLRPEK